MEGGDILNTGLMKLLYHHVKDLGRLSVSSLAMSHRDEMLAHLDALVAAGSLVERDGAYYVT